MHNKESERRGDVGKRQCPNTTSQASSPFVDLLVALAQAVLKAVLHDDVVPLLQAHLSGERDRGAWQGTRRWGVAQGEMCGAEGLSHQTSTSHHCIACVALPLLSCPFRQCSFPQSQSLPTISSMDSLPLNTSPVSLALSVTSSLLTPASLSHLPPPLPHLSNPCPHQPCSQHSEVAVLHIWLPEAVLLAFRLPKEEALECFGVGGHAELSKALQHTTRDKGV